MANTFKTNSLTELVAVRFAETAAYLTVGSKKYFAGQLEGKRNGQTYKFVVRDTGEAVNSLAIGSSDKVELSEREVSMTLDPWHIGLKTNAVESVTDVKWDEEIAQPTSQKLVNAVVRKAVTSDLGKVGTAFVGSGFVPLSRASAHLSSITSEKIFGFIDPNIEAVLTANGQQFVPVGAPAMYKTGLLGEFHGAEYRSQRFFSQVNISSAAETELTGVSLASASAYADNGNGTATLTIGLGAGATQAFAIPKGAVIWVDGVYSCDCVGDVTGNLHAFVVLSSVSVSASDTSAAVTVRAVDLSSSVNTSGTREVAKADGTKLAASDFNSAKIAIPEAGTYFAGILRAEGSFEFETLDRLDAEGADYEKGSVNGITVHKNKLVDLDAMTNTTRFDIVSMAGIVEPRACAYVLVK